MSDRGSHVYERPHIEACCARIEARAVLACLRIKALVVPMAGRLCTSTAFTGAQMLERLQSETPPRRG